MNPRRLDARTVHGFVETFLIDRFDERAGVGKHHLAWWRLVCEDYPYVAIAGPRRHAKTTALNHSFGLAAALFQTHNFQLKVSKTWDLAIERIAHVKDELTSNQKLIDFFKPKKFVTDQKDDIIVELMDGYQFRMVAMGMDQAKRGKSWGTVRPKLIIYDDTEDDEEVLNPNSRRAHFNRIRNVFLPMGGDNTWHRFFGTVLHQDSTLMKLLKSRAWHSSRYEACDEMISVPSILWPEKFSQERLQKIKDLYIDDLTDEDNKEYSGGLAGFNMEYRNLALDLTTSFFRPEDFRVMDEDDEKKKKNYYVGGDLAFSTKEHRDYTVFFVVGIDEDGIGYVVDQRRGRWDGKRVIDEMYSIEEAWHPDEWFIEGGAIKATLGAALELRMAKEGYLNICPDLLPTKDKATRAFPIQARMRGRGLKWDTRTSWFYDAQQELLEFTQEGTRGAHDDRVDALAWVGQGLKRMVTPETEEEEEEEILAEFRKEAFTLFDNDGRSSVTGY